MLSWSAIFLAERIIRINLRIFAIGKDTQIMTRIEREKKVVGEMIAVYCRKRHGSRKGELCDDCRALMDYALARLDHCPKGEEKSSCRKCEIHCYLPDRRERIREVMRFVGPRMMFISPVSAVRHLVDEMK